MGLAVLPEYQAMGVGSRLMGDFINEMKSSGYRHILLTCKEEKSRIMSGLDMKISAFPLLFMAAPDGMI